MNNASLTPKQTSNEAAPKIYAPVLKRENAPQNKAAYEALRSAALADPAEFWGERARKWVWDVSFTKVKKTSFDPENPEIKWFEDGCFNICYNAVDQHAKTAPDKIAMIWEGDNPEESESYSYTQLLHEVSVFANVLKASGVGRGDRVILYLPMIPQAVFAMLACARIGAVHCAVFGGFSANALKDRAVDCGAKVIVTADESLRGGKKTPLKSNVDQALASGETAVETVLVIQRTQTEEIEMQAGRDIFYHEAARKVSADCPHEIMSAEDPLFILYTSGSTGKPKGLLHTIGGYAVYAAFTHDLAFAPQKNDVYFCTADIGWITGHSYAVYGPLMNQCTTLIFEGVPTYPDASRLWRIVDKHAVTILYTAPTALRSLIALGDEHVKRCKRSTLRVLGSVGEPINPDVWEWYHRVVGEGRCDVTDTWWQTETGGLMIASVPGVSDCMPGSAGLPLPGVRAAIIDDQGKMTETGAATGALVILDSWPGQARTLHGDPERFAKTYFSTYPHAYFTGDGAVRDERGLYRVTGRIDDVLNVSGHRIGTAELESALTACPQVAEAAVVGFEHPIKGQGIYAFVTPVQGVVVSAELEKTVKLAVRENVGPVAAPDIIQFASDLPKTRSGKIMRRLLRKIVENDTETVGDVSTLANPETVRTLIEEAQKIRAQRNSS